MVSGDLVPFPIAVLRDAWLFIRRLGLLLSILGAAVLIVAIAALIGGTS